MANHLGPLPEASDGPDGQEPPAQAAGGQGHLHGSTRPQSKPETRLFKPQVFGYGESFGTIARGP